MSHVGWILKFLDDGTWRTAKEICDYLIQNHVKFNCTDERRITSVSSHLNKLVKSKKLQRRKNADGVFEYHK